MIPNDICLDIIIDRILQSYSYSNLFDSLLNIAQCFNTPAVLAHLSIPLNNCRYFCDISAPPPQAASTCIHKPYFSHRSATASSGSKAPSTVVPAVADTMNGRAPSSTARRISVSKCSARSLPRPSVWILYTLSAPMPIKAANFCTE